MKMYPCPACKQDGITWFGRRYSVQPMPTQCRHCKRHFYPKRRADKYPRELIVMEVLFWIAFLAGLYLKLFGIFGGALLLAGYFWLSGAIAERVTYLVPSSDE